MILAIDTATRLLSVALYTENQVLAEHTWKTANQHSTELPPAVQKMLQQMDTSLNTLTAIAVACGPGSYTGVRIGLGFAKGLAMAQQLPLIPVLTPDILAAGTPHLGDSLAVLLQAGRGRVILAQYRWQENQWQPENELSIQPQDGVLDMLSPGTLINGAISASLDLRIQQLGFMLLSPGYRLRRAGFLAHVAAQRAGVDPVQVTPFYINQV